jgi:serine/threonine protein kinase
VHDATTITHRDIRPANIIMKYRRLDNNVVPGENNESLQSEYSIFKPSSTQTMSPTASNVEFGEFSPVLIDFGLADYQRIDYKANYSYDFLTMRSSPLASIIQNHLVDPRLFPTKLIMILLPSTMFMGREIR